MSRKGEIFRLRDGKSHLCISDAEGVLVFAQVYYTDPSHAIMEINLDNVKVIPEAEIGELEYLEKLQKKHMELQFNIPKQPRN